MFNLAGRMLLSHHFHKRIITFRSYSIRAGLFAKGRQGNSKLQFQNGRKTKFYKWFGRAVPVSRGIHEAGFYLKKECGRRPRGQQKHGVRDSSDFEPGITSVVMASIKKGLIQLILLLLL
jgi:hypothetical protein